jgi:asparagine synthase (glutamine-hydrolysing)
MCGIAGILTQKTDQNLEQIIAKMQRSLQHRGPDDQGVYISTNRQATFAHTRLSILDLTSAGHQPMSSDNQRYWITFNGEIYNFQELRSQLLAEGVTFHSQTDTEVILKLYQKNGADCVKQLRGMFAFAIWDDLEKTCFLARDPLGIKPLYYYQDGNTLLFASELRAILASQLPKIQLSASGLYSYLTTGSVSEPHTIIESIKILESGHYLQYQSGNITKQKYYEIDFTPQNIDLETAKNQVRTALIESVKYHFISDVPVGIFLSGGIDSTALVALARQTQFGNLQTYSITFAENQWNEGDLAKKTAQQFETNHTEYQITSSVVKELFPQFIKTIDQPTIDGFNTFCVSKLAHDQGTKVVLSGLGGDEFFGGYSSFRQVPKMVRIGQQLQPIKPLIKLLGKGLEKFSNSSKLKRIGDYLQKEANSVNAYSSFRGIFSHQEAIFILNKYLPDHNLQFIEKLALNGELPSQEDEVSLLEITGYMRNQLLRDSDIMSMKWGLELRVPFVDSILLETIAKIPSQIRLQTGKKILIQSVPELPDFIINRPKQGFLFPFEQWLNTELKQMLPQGTVNNQILLDTWYRKWNLGILELWLQEVNK